MGRRLSYETRARMRNNRIAKRYPLFAATGVLDQVVERARWTADEVQADEEHRRERLDEWFDEQRREHAAEYTRRRAELASLIGESEVARREEARRASRWTPQGGEYWLDWIAGQITKAQEEGRRNAGGHACS